MPDLGQDPEPGVREKVSETESERRIAYEVSVSKLEYEY